MTDAGDDFDAMLNQISAESLDQIAARIAAQKANQTNNAIETSDSVLQSVHILDAHVFDHSNQPMFERLGVIVRLLHDSLRELGYDRSLSHAATQIADAQDRLAHVATLTEEAANKVLNAIDRGIPEQEQLGRHAGELDLRWALLADGKLDADEIKALAADSRSFATAVACASEMEKARLLEIMMAQDFQDITGQLIKKIVAIINTVERELAQLLRDNAPPALRAAIATEQSRPDDLMQGPSLPGAALAQYDVDDLLDSLGF